jgi:hypothetical protein
LHLNILAGRANRQGQIHFGVCTNSQR